MMHLQRLPNARPGEQVILLLHRHWIDVLRIFMFTTLLIIIPLFVGGTLVFVNAPILSHAVFGPILLSLLGAYLLIVLSVTLTEITDYWLDVWIVTNERIINSEQHGLFNRVVSEVHLNQIQDITSEQRGLLGTFLTFGNVYAQTAAERERFTFKNIDNPDTVKIHIGELITTCKTTHHHTPEEMGPAGSQLKNPST
ncbi:MAG: PH domain-containing protein [Patescibacteria group bacterium]